MATLHSRVDIDINVNECVVIRDTKFQTHDSITPYRLEVLRGYIRDVAHQQQNLVRLGKACEDMRAEIDEKDNLLKENGRIIESFRKKEAEDVSCFKEEMSNQLRIQCDKITHLNTKLRELMAENATIESELMSTQCRERELTITNQRLTSDLERLTKELSCYRDSTGVHGMRMDELQASIEEKITLITILQSQLQQLTRSSEEQQVITNMWRDRLDHLTSRLKGNISQQSNTATELTAMLQHIPNQSEVTSQSPPSPYYQNAPERGVFDSVIDRLEVIVERVPNLDNLREAVRSTVQRLQIMVNQLTNIIDERDDLDRKLQSMALQSSHREVATRWMHRHTLCWAETTRRHLESLYVGMSERCNGWAPLLELPASNTALMNHNIQNREFQDELIRDLSLMQVTMDAPSDLLMLEGLHRLALVGHFEVSWQSLLLHFHTTMNYGLNRRLSNTQEELINTTSTLQVNQYRLQELNHIIENTNRELDTRNTLISDLNCRVDQLSRKCEQLEYAVAEAAKEHTSLENIKNELEIRNYELSQRFEDIKSVIHKKDNQVKELEEQNNGLLLKVRTSQDQITKYNNDIDALKREVANLIESGHLLRSEKASIMKKLETTESELVISNNEREALQRVLSKRLQSLTDVDGRLDHAVNRLEISIETILKDFNSTGIPTLTTLHPNEMTNGVHMNPNKENEAENIMPTTKGVFNRLTQSLMSKVEQLESMLRRNEECRCLISGKDSRIYELQDACRDMGLKVKSTEERIVGRENQIRELQNELDQTKLKIAELTLTLEDDKDRELALRRDVERMWMHLSRIDTEVASAMETSLSWITIPSTTARSRSARVGRGPRRTPLKEGANHQLQALKESQVMNRIPPATPEDKQLVRKLPVPSPANDNALAPKWQR